jgi:hypothetical protein
MQTFFQVKLHLGLLHSLNVDFGYFASWWLSKDIKL